MLVLGLFCDEDGNLLELILKSCGVRQDSLKLIYEISKFTGFHMDFWISLDFLDF